MGALFLYYSSVLYDPAIFHRDHAVGHRGCFLPIVGDENYVFFDVRKAEDSAKATIPGAAAHDMDAAKEGDFAHGVATMQLATRGLDKNIILVCYSGKRYAQASTNVLSALGYDMSKVFTLEGGMKAWTEAGNAVEAK